MGQAFVINHPEEARTLLQAHPQLAQALFQALITTNIVDPKVLEVSDRQSIKRKKKT